MKARKWVLASRFNGVPKDDDVQLREEELPELKDGEVLLKALYLSVDPYMRPYSARLDLGSTMMGQQVAEVVKSRNPGYPVGKRVLAGVGWRDKTVVDLSTPKTGSIVMNSILPIWDIGDLPLSVALGVLGMPGASAYFGFLRICEPKAGETVFVNSAAGIVGSIVGQIAKIKGCRVIGCAGVDDKCKWLRDELGFDFVFNYKTDNLVEALKKGAPDGIDCYFDNVGGDMTTTVIEKFMNRHGRISCCGVLSIYNATSIPKGNQVYMHFVQKELKMQGFLVDSFRDEVPKAFTEMLQWIKEGKLKWKEDVVDGFENTRAALYGLLDGKYTGKVVVKANL